MINREDISRIESKLDELIESGLKINAFLESKIKRGKKNSHLHILIETSLKNEIEEEAKKQGLTLSEFIRLRLRGIL